MHGTVVPFVAQVWPAQHCWPGVTEHGGFGTAVVGTAHVNWQVQPVSVLVHAVFGVVWVGDAQ